MSETIKTAWVTDTDGNKVAPKTVTSQVTTSDGIKNLDTLLAEKGNYSKPSGGIPKTDLASSVQTSLGKADTALQSYTEKYTGTYNKPSTGIPKTDLANDIQTSLNKADNALQATFLTGSISSGENSIIFENQVIKDTSIIDIYTSIYGLNPKSVTATNGSLTIIFDTLTNDVDIKVVII